MSYECLIILFDKYQTFLVGVLGFGGVIITIIMNTKALRKQHNRQIEHDRNTLRTAIYSELKLIQVILKDRCKMDEEKGGFDSAFFPKEISSQIYLQNINKLGLLTLVEIEAVIEAYALINDLPLRLGLLSTDRDPTFDREGYIYVEAQHTKVAISIHKKFLIKIDSVLKIIKDKINAT